MTIIRIDDELHKEVSKLVGKGDRIEYPSIKNFIDKAIKEKLSKVGKKK